MPNPMSKPSHPHPRWQAQTLQHMLTKRRVVVLTGPRQCGKTTLVKQFATSNAVYRTLDDATLHNAAISDPKGFIKHNQGLMIIDEVQRAPALLQAIKQDVDENPNFGRFLLTGSANIQSLPNVNESLAGRVSTIRLRTLAQGELAHQPAQFLHNAFQQNLNQHQNASCNPAVWDKDHYLIEAFAGGFPEARSFTDEMDQRAWHQDYVQALVERDLKDIANIKRKDAMFKLLEILAAWSSKFMDISSIAQALSLSRPTLESYINALETLYLIERVRPWHKTDYDRVGKREKLFMTDTGLMAALLNWRFANVRLDGDMNGKLIETMVFNELAAQLDVHPHEYTLTHYRDAEQREVDFIIERDDGAVLGIEVKASSAIHASAFKHLNWFEKNIVPKQTFIGIVLYTGEHTVPFGSNRWAVPIAQLWA